jgi:hypothetical protein
LFLAFLLLVTLLLEQTGTLDVLQNDATLATVDAITDGLPLCRGLLIHKDTRVVSVVRGGSIEKHPGAAEPRVRATNDDHALPGPALQQAKPPVEALTAQELVTGEGPCRLQIGEPVEQLWVQALHTPVPQDEHAAPEDHYLLSLYDP